MSRTIRWITAENFYRPQDLRRTCLIALVCGALIVFFAGWNPAAGDQHFLSSAQKYFDAGDLAAAQIEVKNALRSNPSDARVRFLLGKIYLRQGNAVAAEQELLRAQRLGVAGDELDLMLAYARLAKGSYEQVLSGVSEELALSSEIQRDLFVARGDAMLSLGNVVGAEEIFDAVLANKPHAVALARKASIAMTREDQAKARELLDRGLALDPDNEDLVATDARWYVSERRFEVARQRFTRAIELNPRRLPPYLGRIQATLALGDTEGAMALVEELKQSQPDNLLVALQDSVVQLNAGNHEAAKGAADRVLAASERNAGALKVSGLSAYALGLYEQAVTRMTQYLTLAPEDDQARRVLAASLLKLEEGENAKAVLKPLLAEPSPDAQLLALMGTAEAMTGNSEAAVDYFDRAAGLSPEDTNLRARLGLVRIGAGDTAQGVADLEQTLALDPGRGSGEDLDPLETALMSGYLRLGDFDAALEASQRLQKAHPDNTSLLVVAGLAHTGRGETDLAKAAYSKAIKLDPARTDARLNLARLETQGGNLDKSKALLESLLENQPGHYLALLHLAGVAELSGDAEQAMSRLRQAVEAEPTLPTPRVLLATLLLQSQQPQQALETVRPMLARYPDRIDLLGLAGQSQLELGETDEAIAAFERLLENSPRAVQARFLLARAYGQSGKHDAMRDQLDRALEVNPDHLPSKVALVRHLALTDKAGEAKIQLQELKAAFPGHPEVLAQEGWLALREGRPEDAAAVLQVALDNAGPGAGRNIVESLALAYRQSRNLPESVAVRENWLEKNPDDVFMLLAVAQEYRLTGRREDAIRTYRHLLTLTPDGAMALNNLAWLLQYEQPEESLELAERANKAAPGQPSILDTLGWLLLQQGQAARAAEFFEQAAELAPQNPQYRYHLAQALDGTDQEDRAIELLQELLADERLTAEHEKIRKMLTRISAE